MAIDPSAFIHPKAHVEGAEIGARTKVWQFASVTGAKLGADCSIWPHVMLDGPVFGDRCKIASGVAMGPGFLFGNDVFVGPNVTVCNDQWPRVERDGFDYDALRSGQWAVIVGDGASIGANAVVLPGAMIGRGSVIAAGAVVNRDVPDVHLFRRDGSCVPLDPAKMKARMRYAGTCRCNATLGR